MGNRSKYVAVTAAAIGAAVAAKRRARWRAAADGIQDAIMPTHVIESPTDPEPLADEAHAPGHEHLPAPDGGEPGPAPLRGRPWTKHAHGMGHPFSGN